MQLGNPLRPEFHGALSQCKHHGVRHRQLGQGRQHGRSHHGRRVQCIALAAVQQRDAVTSARQPPGQAATGQTGTGNAYVQGPHAVHYNGWGQGGLRLKGRLPGLPERAWAVEAVHGPVPIYVVPYAGMTPIRFSGFHVSGLSLDIRLWRPDKQGKCMRSSRRGWTQLLLPYTGTQHGSAPSAKGKHRQNSTERLLIRLFFITIIQAIRKHP